MQGDWITGAELLAAYGKQAAELGRACHAGLLHPFTKDSLFPVFDETKLAHIPKYPPEGVNPLEHIQYGAVPHWDWGHLEPDRFNQKAVRSAREMNLAGDAGMDVFRTALDLMQCRYDYYCDAESTELTRGHFKTFCFLLQDFLLQIKTQPLYFMEPKTDAEIIEIYKQCLSELLFRRSEGEAWAQGAPIPSTASPLEVSPPPVSFLIASRVSSEGRGMRQVENTRTENQAAFAFVKEKNREGWPLENIARELKDSGGGKGGA